MKAEDLRIGNLLQEHFTSQVIKVIELKHDTIVTTGNFKDKWQAEPLPITEERILQLGFKKIFTDSYYFGKNWLGPKGEVKKIYIRLIGNGKCVYIDGNTHPMEFVHQLQNLYHAATLMDLDTSKVR